MTWIPYNAAYLCGGKVRFISGIRTLPAPKHGRSKAVGHPQSQWQNKKRYGNKIYSGHYRRDENGEREFILVFRLKNGSYHVISAESPYLLELAGWKLLNPRASNRKQAAKQKSVRRKK